MSDPFVYATDVQSVGVKHAHVAVVSSAIDDREALFACLIRELKLPGHFGRNWDALDECLRDLSWFEQHRVVLFHEALPGLDREQQSTYCQILRDAVLDWREDPDDELVVVFPPAVRDATRQLLG